MNEKNREGKVRESLRIKRKTCNEVTYTASESFLFQSNEHVSIGLGHNDAEQSLGLFLHDETEIKGLRINGQVP